MRRSYCSCHKKDNMDGDKHFLCNSTYNFVESTFMIQWSKSLIITITLNCCWNLPLHSEITWLHIMRQSKQQAQKCQLYDYDRELFLWRICGQLIICWAILSWRNAQQKVVIASTPLPQATQVYECIIKYLYQLPCLDPNGSTKISNDWVTRGSVTLTMLKRQRYITKYPSRTKSYVLNSNTLHDCRSITLCSEPHQPNSNHATSKNYM